MWKFLAGVAVTVAIGAASSYFYGDPFGPDSYALKILDDDDFTVEHISLVSGTFTYSVNSEQLEEARMGWNEFVLWRVPLDSRSVVSANVVSTEGQVHTHSGAVFTPGGLYYLYVSAEGISWLRRDASSDRMCDSSLGVAC